MKIAFVLDDPITCGGVIVPFQYCRELNRKGLEAAVYANGRNEELEKFYGVEVRPIRELESFTDDDVIVACWWPQVEELEKYKGIKIQFVQGNDLVAYIGDDLKERCLKTRQRENWDIIAVSKYAGKWTGRGFLVIPNGIDDRFYRDYGVEKEFDILIEGNYEPNKNIDESVEIAKKVSDKILWVGRETRNFEGIRVVTNPPQDSLPRLYQRCKVLLKLSKSEGFCLPILECMASGVAVVTRDMGGNERFCFDGINCEGPDKIEEVLKNDKWRNYLIENGKKTAQYYHWLYAIDSFLEYIDLLKKRD